MKHGVMAGRPGRVWRAGLTAVVSLSLVASATSSVATGLDDEVGGPDAPAAVTERSGTVTPAAAGEEPVEQPGEASSGQEAAPTQAAPVAPDVAPTTSEPAPEVSTVPETAPETDTEPAGDALEAEAPQGEEPTGDEVAARSTDAPSATVTPLAVPQPSNNTAVITVKVGGDRTAPAAVAGLAGVRLRLYDGTGSPTTPVGEQWAECVSDSTGDCSFVVPETQAEVTECIIPFFFGCLVSRTISEAGVNRDRQFWVVPESVPTGWYASQALVTGGRTSQESTPYRFRTGAQLRSGQTYTAGSAFMTAGNDSTRAGSAGTWQVSRANPQLPAKCESGIDVALVLDLSGSVAQAGAVDDLKASATAFVEALQGTGSRLALFTFADTAPRNTSASGRNYSTLLPVDGNLAKIRGWIDGYQADGGTNWDRGIHQVAQDGQHFDLAIVVTDGLATFSGTPATGPGSFTRFAETEQAIFSANALKAEGTRLLAVGVGDGIDGDAANLRAVSGPNGHAAGAPANRADYFQTGWRQLAPLLETLAKGATCQATVTVEKVAQAYAGQPAPAAGWAFGATATGGELAPHAPQVTGASGTLTYTVHFDRPDAAATVRVEEHLDQDERDAGWSLTDVACAVNGEGRGVTVEGTSVALDVTAGDDVECTFTNVQTREPGVEIVKRAWDVAGATELDGARELPPGATVTNGTTLTWTYTVRNTGQTALLDIVLTDRPTVDITCPRTSLDVGEHMVCTGSAAPSPGP